MKSDRSLFDGAEFGAVFVFALSDPFFPIIAPKLVFDDFFTIQPVFDVGAVDENAHMIPFAGRLGSIFGRGVQIVAGSGQLAFIPSEVRRVVEDLNFGGVMPGGDRFFRDMIENPAVAVFDRFPFQLEIEILKFLDRDNVIAATGAFAAFTAFDADKDAVDDGPAGWHFIHFIAAPAGGCFTVEKEFPTGLTLGSGERVGWGSGE